MMYAQYVFSGVLLDLLYEQNFYHTGSMHMVFHHYVLFSELQDHISEQTFYTFENTDRDNHREEVVPHAVYLFILYN